MARHRAPPVADDRMASRPDDATSGGVVKSEPDDVPSALPSHADAGEEEDDDDPVVRTIDVFLSPALSDTLHLLQFPIHPAVRRGREGHARRDRSTTPAEARFRPKHNMLELEYSVPGSARAAQRQLSDKMCLSQRTFTSDAIAPVTHMALAKLNKDGDRMNVIPLTKSVLQMRPSFRHLHDEDDDDQPAAAPEPSAKKSFRPIMFQKKETERSIAARRNSYAYKRASEEGEEWVELDVHGTVGSWSNLRKEVYQRTKCSDRENELLLARDPRSADADGGYVKSLNYLDSVSLARSGGGERFVENLSDWAPSTIDAIAGELAAAEEDDARSISSAATPIGATEKATAELAAKLAVLLQTGNGTMVPYRVLRSRFHPAKVSDEVLTMALSSCAVLVRGNFSLKSELAKFLQMSGMGGGEERKRRMRELRDLILLLLNMHGTVQRERLVLAYAARGGGVRGYDEIDADAITFVLRTVARRAEDCWVSKVEDDEGFAADFPEVAACHGVYWMKKKDLLIDLIELYENAESDDAKDDDGLCPSILDNSV